MSLQVTSLTQNILLDKVDISLDVFLLLECCGRKRNVDISYSVFFYISGVISTVYLHVLKSIHSESNKCLVCFRNAYDNLADLITLYNLIAKCIVCYRNRGSIYCIHRYIRLPLHCKMKFKVLYTCIFSPPLNLYAIEITHKIDSVKLLHYMAFFI